MLIQCSACGKTFDALQGAKTCSKTCARIRKTGKERIAYERPWYREMKNQRRRYNRRFKPAPVFWVAAAQPQMQAPALAYYNADGIQPDEALAQMK
jgi:hypothetical protein